MSEHERNVYVIEKSFIVFTRPIDRSPDGGALLVQHKRDEKAARNFIE
jgi:hypothetical protein